MPDLSSIPPEWGLGGGILLVLLFVLVIVARVVFKLVPPLVELIANANASSGKVLEVASRIASSQERADANDQRIGEMLIAATNTMVRHEEREAERHTIQMRAHEQLITIITEGFRAGREHLEREIDRPAVTRRERGES